MTLQKSHKLKIFFKVILKNKFIKINQLIVNKYKKHINLIMNFMKIQI